MFKLERYQENPILLPEPKNSWESQAVFNPGVIKKGGTFYMLYRAVGNEGTYMSRFGLATSTDGLRFNRVHDTPILYPAEDYEEGAIEDCRLTEIEGEIYITYTAVAEQLMLDGKPFKPLTIPINVNVGLIRTKDFERFERLGLISSANADDKNTVLFPEKIGGKYVKLHRPHRWSKRWFKTPLSKMSPIDLPCSEADLPEKPAVWISYSDNLHGWSGHKLLFESTHDHDEKIGSGPPPLLTKEGWLLVYHHVTENRRDLTSNYIYDARVALLDRHDPSRIIAKIPESILEPQEWYEKEGDVNNVVFPTGAVIEGNTLFVYYGGADKFCAVATGNVDELLAELLENRL